jgi:hypothetical protein
MSVAADRYSSRSEMERHHSVQFALVGPCLKFDQLSGPSSIYCWAESSVSEFSEALKLESTVTLPRPSTAIRPCRNWVKRPRWS